MSEPTTPLPESVVALRRVVDAENRHIQTRCYYHCPACDEVHGVNILPGAQGPTWSWNGCKVSPTLSPSVLVYVPRPDGTRDVLCHHFVRDGHVQVCGDSPKRPNEVLPLGPLPEWLRAEETSPGGPAW